MGDSDQRIASRLEEIELWLGKSVGDAFSTAVEVEVPGGSSPAWLEILKSHNVQPNSEEERLRVAAATGMTRGVPADELYEVLDKLSNQAEVRIKRLDYPDDSKLQLRYDKLQGLIGRVRDETLAAYRKMVIPKRSMFAAAKASAMSGAGKTAVPERKGESFVMRCDNCGAPRLKSDDFVCEYCDTPYA
jgi:hypothetical protein